MSEANQTDMNKLLDEIKSEDASTRKRAAEELRTIAVVNEQVFNALDMVCCYDKDPEVAAAARQTMEAPVFQSFIHDKKQVGIKGKPAEIIGTCEKCKKTLQTGLYYSFYFARRGASRSEVLGYARRTTTNYSIEKTPMKTFLCNHCIGLNFILSKFLLAFVAVLAFFFLLIFSLLFSQYHEVNWLAVLAIEAFVLIMLNRHTTLFRGKVEFAEKMAIRIHKQKLRRQGYDSFFTTSAMKKFGIHI